MRLPGYLVAALTGGDLAAVIDLEAHLLAEVEAVIDVVASDGDGLPVDKAVELQGGAEGRDLLHNLLHLAVGKRIVA